MIKKSVFILIISVLSIIGTMLQTVSAEETEKGLNNKLKWSTASEVNNFGYDIYRAEHKDGPFQRITKQPVVGAGTTDIPTHYEYIDATIEAGQRYYYYIESISLSGQRKKFTPTLEAAPKLPEQD